MSRSRILWRPRRCPRRGRTFVAAGFGLDGPGDCRRRYFVFRAVTPRARRRAAAVGFRRRRLARVPDAADGDVSSDRDARRGRHAARAAAASTTACSARRAAGCTRWSRTCSTSAASRPAGARIEFVDIDACRTGEPRRAGVPRPDAVTAHRVECLARPATPSPLAFAPIVRHWPWRSETWSTTRSSTRRIVRRSRVGDAATARSSASPSRTRAGIPKDEQRDNLPQVRPRPPRAR